MEKPVENLESTFASIPRGKKEKIAKKMVS